MSLIFNQSSHQRPRRRRHRNDPIDPETFEPRPSCWRCIRPVSQCVCQLVSPFRAHCDLLVLQHFHERKKYYNTVKLLSAAVTNCTVQRGIIFDEQQLSLTERHVLLYPRADAYDCTAFELTPQHTVVVIDGTWEEAQKIFFNNKQLHRLPAIAFPRDDANSPRSRYRIRKQPEPHFLSTLESVAYLLQRNAEAFGKASDLYGRLLEGFDQMVARQLAFVPKVPIEDTTD